MGHRTRTKIAKGIHKDKFGVAIVVSVRGKPREFRKDKDGRKYATYSKDALIQERIQVQAREQLIAEKAAVRGEDLSADTTAYLKTLSGRTKDDALNLLDHWLSEFGDRHRTSLTALELRQYAATWKIAASTFNHRRQALISLYVALDGKSGYNPAREIPKRQEIQGAPKALSYTIINAALAALPATKSRARLKLMAYTGLPQMQVQKLAPEDWHGSRLRVTPRRKGSGVAGRWLPLSTEAIKALEEFAAVKAWGPFSRSSLCKAWKSVGPTGTNPYSLRHSWITELYRRSNGDVLAVKQLALHSMLQQTERYAAAALEDRMAALVVPRKSATTGQPNRSNSLRSNAVGRKTRSRTSQRGKRSKSVKKARN